ncbi:hypothetical protein [Sagittula sp. S175]|uniref:hypothetical protein n=1 Tax=Sagittula sp. S175 TaxID=3415129 RepID=UPI003C7D38BA
MPHFGARFGRLICRKREERGWSYARMASEVLPNAGPGGETRKGDIQKLEDGQTKKPTAKTLKYFRDAGIVTQDEIDACRTPAEIELARYAHRLLTTLKDAVAQSHVPEALAEALAERFAEGNPDSFDNALNELANALRVAAEQQARAGLPSNTDDAVDAVLAEVDRLNAEGQIEDAGEYLRRKLAEDAEEMARREAAHLRLVEKGLAQAVLERDVDWAAALELDRWTREGGGFEALRAVQDVWYERGRDKGLGFDLEVAIALARACLSRARDADERGKAQNDLGIALWSLGARESGTTRLEEAVTAFRAALEEWTRDRVPLDWAMTQNNLGNALQSLGERQSGTLLLQEAVTAYRAAQTVRTRNRVPLEWAMTQNNLGTALQTLGERESGTARLEESVTAYRAALEEYTRDRVPLDWASVQNNLGTALGALGERVSGTERLEEAVTAYRAALEERTRARVPLDWAGTVENIGLAQEALFEKTGEAAYLDDAEASVRAARKVWEEAGASYYIGKSDWILADISKRRAGLRE